MSYYNTCPLCGANLDPGERCDCRIITDWPGGSRVGLDVDSGKITVYVGKGEPSIADAVKRAKSVAQARRWGEWKEARRDG